MRPVALVPALLAAAVLAAGCGLVPPWAPNPLATAEPPAVPQPEMGAVDWGIASIDALALLRAQKEGAGCEAWNLVGGAGFSDGFSNVQSFTCPRIGDTRDIWFEFADAWEAAMRNEGARIGGTSSHMSLGEDPIEKAWSIRGDRSAGTSHLMGISTPDRITLILTTDLVPLR